MQDRVAEREGECHLGDEGRACAHSGCERWVADPSAPLRLEHAGGRATNQGTQELSNDICEQLAHRELAPDAHSERHGRVVHGAAQVTSAIDGAHERAADRDCCQWRTLACGHADGEAEKRGAATFGRKLDSEFGGAH